jgi:hypothetical protein
MFRLTVIIFMGGLLLMTAMSGCRGADGRKANDDNYNQVKTGMTYDEVVNILGKPDEDHGGGGAVDGIGGSGRVATWNMANGRKISITFVNDKVTVKTIRD